ncbi:Cysteine--tRNA ligase [Trichinella spiralis]|uniref:Cysteine--tRNA ligase n=1 Tax=Trichinella spiralis TaxID=6334 RepID=A0ABR3K9X9_TRISP
MPSPAFEDDSRGHPRCLTGIARQQQPESLLEAWKRTADATPAADGCPETMDDQISSDLNREPEIGTLHT